MSELLLIEATEELQALAQEAERGGFRVSTATLDEAHQLLGRGDAFDAVIVNLTAGAGLPAIADLLESDVSSGAATLAVVSRDAVSDLPADLPVDDFVVLPAARDEALSRLRRAVRRRAREDDSNLLRCGDLMIDQASYQVHVGSRPVVLTYKEYELLRFLAQNQDKVCTRETLLNRVWGYDFYGGARTVDVHIRRLRSKIEDPDQSLIETVRNVGYRLRAAPRTP